MVQIDPKKESVKQFGCGLGYSLGLFLAQQAEYKHALAEIQLMAAEGAISFDGSEMRDPDKVRHTIERLAAVRWFSTAAIPLRNLIIPQPPEPLEQPQEPSDYVMQESSPIKASNALGLSDDIRKRLQDLKDRCYQWSFPASTSKRPNRRDVEWSIEQAKELLRLIDENYGVKTIKEQHDAQTPRSPCLVFRD